MATGGSHSALTWNLSAHFNHLQLSRENPHRFYPMEILERYADNQGHCKPQNSSDLQITESKKHVPFFAGKKGCIVNNGKEKVHRQLSCRQRSPGYEHACKSFL